MVRFSKPADLPALIALMREARMGCEWMTYDDMDGLTLVDEFHGELRGYLRADLGRPETHVRQLVVAPDHQGAGLVARRLLLTLATLAELHGSQAIEGFQEDDKHALSAMWARAGAQVTAGRRTRFPLGDKIRYETARLREA